jgi:hypothetical protein
MSKKLVPQGSHFSCSRPPDPLDRMIIVLQNNGVFCELYCKINSLGLYKDCNENANFAKVHPIWRKPPKNVFARKLFLAKTIRDIAVIVKIV